MQLGGRSRDYILNSVMVYGPLIFIIKSPTCPPEDIIALRSETVMSPALYEFDEPTRAKLLDAWLAMRGLNIPVVCDHDRTHIVRWHMPEIIIDVGDLAIF